MVRLLRGAWVGGQLKRVTRPGGSGPSCCDKVMAVDWVVYSKHCLKHSATVVEYLARYTHRIRDHRCPDSWRVDDDSVTLRYKDYAVHDRAKMLTLAGSGVCPSLPDAFIRAQRADAGPPLWLPG